jgi:DNA ligase-associated metallophosphoesterase
VKLLPQLATREADEPMALHRIAVAGTTLLADPAGALLHEKTGTLLVADLHLEKGSAFARRGVMLPPWDTAATLSGLTRLIRRHAPRRVVALGDSFHDGGGPSRLSPEDSAHLQGLQRGREWLWIAGNHDPALALPGDHAAEASLDTLTLRHEPTGAAGEIAGHLHPCAKVSGKAGTLRRRCFATDGASLVMPAFGAYAGGLNILDAAFAPIFAGPVTAHVLGARAVYAVRAARCRPD